MLRRADWLSLGIVVLAAVLGLALAPRLPSEVAIHFSASGAPDNFVSKQWALVVVPAIAAATVLFVRGAARADSPQDPRPIDVLQVGMAAMLGAVHLAVLGWNAGYQIPISGVAIGAVLWIAGLAGYVVVTERG